MEVKLSMLIYKCKCYIRRRNLLLFIVWHSYIIKLCLRIMGVAPTELVSSCSGRLMFSAVVIFDICLTVKTVGEKVLLSMISLSPKGRCIEQVLTDIWIDFMFNAYSIVPVSN